MTDPGELIRDATIVVAPVMPLSPHTLSEENAPNLQFICCVASGTDLIDLKTCRRRGVKVSNGARANVQSVSEHTIGLYFATRRKVVQSHQIVKQGAWTSMSGIVNTMKGRDGLMPLSCAQETVGIIGYGAIGTRIKEMAGALGMNVIVAERKGAEHCRPDRVPFEDVLQQSTVIILALPKTPESLNLISTSEFQIMRQDTILINISRGGILDETALVEALRCGTIAGAATDVYSKEPAAPTSNVLASEETADLNLVLTPHSAWLAQTTTEIQRTTIKENVEGWWAGKQINVVV